VFDIDGTLANYHAHLSNFVCQYWNLGGWAFDRGIRWDGEGNFEDCFKISQADYREAKLAFRMGGMKRTMPTFEDPGTRLVQWLHDQGVEIWYATTRPWKSLSNVDPDTQWWLEQTGLPVNGILYDEDKYQKLISEVVDFDRVVMIVDDLPEQYDAADALGLPVCQVARPHNRGASGERPRRGTMGQLTKVAMDNLEAWRAKHG